MVGDPGQLDPVNAVDTSNLEASPHKIHWSAPAYVLDRFPETPTHCRSPDACRPARPT